MPSYANYSADSYAYLGDQLLASITTEMIIIIVSLAGLPVVLSVYFLPCAHVSLLNAIKSTPKYKPKIYFHYWGSQLIILSFGLYLVCTNRYSSVNYYAIMMPVYAVFGFVILLCFLRRSGCHFHGETHTPAQCCTGKCKRVWSFLFLALSVSGLSILFGIIIYIAPNIILVYYLYPIRTLTRLPFIITAFTYINSLVALLVFYLERSCYMCWGKYTIEEEEQAIYHRNFYNKNLDGLKDSLKKTTVVCMPVGVLYLLIILILLLRVLADLIFKQTSSTDQLQAILTLVPGLILLFGSWYRRDLLFYDYKDEHKTKKDILKEILQELKRPTEYRPIADNETTGPTETTGSTESSGPNERTPLIN